MFNIFGLLSIIRGAMIANEVDYFKIRIIRRGSDDGALGKIHRRRYRGSTMNSDEVSMAFASLVVDSRRYTIKHTTMDGLGRMFN